MRQPKTITSELLEHLGELVAASTPVTTTSTHVFTGGVLAELPQSTPQDVERAVATARAAQSAWAATPVGDRMKVFRRFHSLILQNRERICDLIQAETGKARKTAFQELCDPLLVTSHYLRAAPKLLRPRRRKGMTPFAIKATEIRQPKGVVGIISPWNFPFALGIADIVPALMAGNGVVLKPDTQTALSPLFGVDLLYRAGLPSGLLQVVLGEGAVVGSAVVDHADYVGFTGSSRTGREVGARASARLVGCSLELGGKNPMIVLDDADVDLAVTGAVNGCYPNAGQLCMHIERLYVHEQIFDTFRDKFVHASKSIKLAAEYGYDPDMGSLTGQNQLKTVSEHVDDARAKGATVLTGGRARPDIGPYFYEPTVLTGVTPDMLCHSAETFGPVVTLSPFSTDDEAVSLANNTEFGLNASVYGGDLKRAEAVARRLRAGTVNVNDALAAAYASIDTPMGGMGSSGVGRRHGEEGLLKYTEAQSVAVQRVQVLDPPKGMPYPIFARIISGSLRFMRAAHIR